VSREEGQAVSEQRQAEASRVQADETGNREEEQPGSAHRVGWIERYRGVLFVALIVGILAGTVVLQAFRPRSNRPILESLTPAPSPEATRTPSPVRVYVTGAVQRPDVYALPAGSIVKDALLAAGGATTDADLIRINLASPLADGQQIYVPRQGEEDLPARLLTAPAAALPLSGGSRVNINTAGEAELDLLPGIGPALAKRIVEYRQTHGPFQTIEQITEVPGIGDAVLEQIRDLVTVE
jgi:competence protein ComEA